MKISILLHVVSILLAFLISFWIIFQTKGTQCHRILGWIFTVCMLTSAISSFWIQTGGGLGLIHLLSLATIYWLVQGVLAARLKKDRQWRYKHAYNMASAYIAILIAGTGFIVRHFIAPGNVLLGGIVSVLTALVVIPIMIKVVNKYKS